MYFVSLEGELSQLCHTNPPADFRYYPRSCPSTPVGAAIGFPTHPAGPIRPPCFGDGAHLAMMNGISGLNGPVGPLGPVTPPGDMIPLSGGYYQPCIKPLSFPTSAYAPSFPRRFDSTHVTPHSAQPVLMDGFVHPSPQQRAIKLYPTIHYKMNGGGPSSPAQLSTGSTPSPYSDTAPSPSFGGPGKIEPLTESPQTSGFVPQHSIKEESPWNLPLDSEGARVTHRTYCTYYSYMPSNAVNGAADPGGWGSATSEGVWASPNQATPSDAAPSSEDSTEDSNSAEKEGTENER